MEISYRDWKVVREIARGSYGTVYEIEREVLGKLYKSALKVISIPQNNDEILNFRSTGNWSNEDTAEHFMNIAKDLVNEFDIMYKLNGHTNIVSYHDHEIVKHEDGIGLDIMVRMELLTPLDKYISDPSTVFTRRDVIKLGIDICKALERCETFDIVHRDIKPSNIFVSDSGDFKLGDFGIAKTIGNHSATSFELSKKGTYNYMAPELYNSNGEKNCGYSVDQYSLGIVLYRLLNYNRIPFLPPYPMKWNRMDNEKAIAIRMSGEMPVPRPSRDHTRLAEIVLKACNFDPEQRYSGPTDMRKDLEAILYDENEWNEVKGESDEITIPTDSSGSSGKGRSSKKGNTITTDDETMTLFGPPYRPFPEKEKNKHASESSSSVKKYAFGIVALAIIVGGILLLPKLFKNSTSGTLQGNGNVSNPEISESKNETSADETENENEVTQSESGARIVTEEGDVGYTIIKEYDDRNLLIKETQNHADGTLAFTVEYTYDESDNLLTETMYRANGEVSSKSEFEYNEHNQKIRQNNYKNDQFTEYQLYSWESDEKQSGYKVYNAEDELLESHTFDYDESGTYLEIVEAEGDTIFAENLSIDGTIIKIYKIIYDYDVSGQMIRQSDYDKSGQLVDYCEIKYDYRFRQTQQSWYYGNGIVEGHIEYKYSDDGSTIEQILYDANGSILNYIQNEHGPDGTLTITQYDENRSIVAQQVYDEEGNQIPKN